MILEDDNVGPPGGVAGQLERAFDGLCARVGKEKGVQRFGHNGQQFLDQLQQGLCRTMLA